VGRRSAFFAFLKKILSSSKLKKLKIYNYVKPYNYRLSCFILQFEQCIVDLILSKKLKTVNGIEMNIKVPYRLAIFAIIIEILIFEIVLMRARREKRSSRSRCSSAQFIITLAVGETWERRCRAPSNGAPPLLPLQGMGLLCSSRSHLPSYVRCRNSRGTPCICSFLLTIFHKNNFCLYIWTE